MMSSTYRSQSSVFSRKIPSGNSLNWLSPKRLPTNNHNQCQLHNKDKIKEFVLGGSIHGIEKQGKENKNNEK